MKLYHYVLFFICFIVPMIFIMDMKIEEKCLLQDEVQLADEIFDRAVDEAVGQLSLEGNKLSGYELEAASEAFYDSLAASYGISDAPLSRRNLELYVPVMAVTSNDGFYVNYNRIMDKDKTTEVLRCWSGKISYSYYENDAPAGYRATGFVILFTGKNSCFVYDSEGILGEKGRTYELIADEIPEEITEILKGKKNYHSILTDIDEFLQVRNRIMAERLEKALTYYCNNNNEIAKSRGIEYSFRLPAVDASVYLRAAENVSFLAFFQGYPINGADKVYNSFSIANAQLIEKKEIIQEE